MVRELSAPGFTVRELLLEDTVVQCGYWDENLGARYLFLSAATGETLSAQEVYRRVNPSVVTVMVQLSDGIGVGTGVIFTEDGYILFWTAPKGKGWKDEAVKYVVYRIAKGERFDIYNPNNIVAITTDTYYKLPYHNGSEKYTYAVTALDRMQNESKPAKTKVKL